MTDAPFLGGPPPQATPSVPPSAETLEAQRLFPKMFAKPAAVQVRSDASADEKLAASLFPTMHTKPAKPTVEAPAKPAEAPAKPQATSPATNAKRATTTSTDDQATIKALFPSMVGKPGDQQQQSEEISAALAEQFEDLDIDHPAVQAFVGLAAELDLPVGDCAKLVEMHEDTVIAENLEQARVWTEEWQSRPNADALLATANAVLRDFGSDELRAWLRETVTGRNPELIAFISSIGKALGYGPMKRR